LTNPPIGDGDVDARLRPGSPGVEDRLVGDRPDSSNRPRTADDASPNVTLNAGTLPAVEREFQAFAETLEDGPSRLVMGLWPGG